MATWCPQRPHRLSTPQPAWKPKWRPAPCRWLPVVLSAVTYTAVFSRIRRPKHCRTRGTRLTPCNNTESQLSHAAARLRSQALSLAPGVLRHNELSEGACRKPTSLGMSVMRTLCGDNNLQRESTHENRNSDRCHVAMCWPATTARSTNNIVRGAAAGCKRHVGNVTEGHPCRLRSATERLWPASGGVVHICGAASAGGCEAASPLHGKQCRLVGRIMTGCWRAQHHPTILPTTPYVRNADQVMLATACA